MKQSYVLFCLIIIVFLRICCSENKEERVSLSLLPQEVLINITSFMKKGEQGYELFGSEAFQQPLKMWQEDHFKAIGKKLASRDLRRSMLKDSKKFLENLKAVFEKSKKLKLPMVEFKKLDKKKEKYEPLPLDEQRRKDVLKTIHTSYQNYTKENYIKYFLQYGNINYLNEAFIKKNNLDIDYVSINEEDINKIAKQFARDEEYEEKNEIMKRIEVLEKKMENKKYTQKYTIEIFQSRDKNKYVTAKVVHPKEQDFDRFSPVVFKALIYQYPNIIRITNIANPEFLHVYKNDLYNFLTMTNQFLTEIMHKKDEALSPFLTHLKYNIMRIANINDPKLFPSFFGNNLEQLKDHIRKNIHLPTIIFQDKYGDTALHLEILKNSKVLGFNEYIPILNQSMDYRI